MNTIIEDLRQELRKRSDEKERISGERFFKEQVRLYGIKVPVVHRISRDFFKKLPDKDKQAVFLLCRDLWKSGYLEESFVACNWSYAVRKQFTEADIKIFGEWVDKYVTNWASCDTFCNHTVGEPLERFPSWLENLKDWAKSKNRWMRRASAVSLIIPARKGKFLNDILRIADTLLTDNDDMVQKGYGWMLKAASQARQKEVFDYVIKNKAVMPRTSLRYAIEKMPAYLKAEAMKR